MAQARSFLESERGRIFYFVCFCAFADADFGSAFNDFRKVLVLKKQLLFTYQNCLIIVLCFENVLGLPGMSIFFRGKNV